MWVAGKLVPISSSLWARGRVHPGQVFGRRGGGAYLQQSMGERWARGSIAGQHRDTQDKQPFTPKGT
ncbi:hypothetical protein CHARACLAT_020007 [Characodon lateralis]|uniref:Uncharacterized protein n=1 Tax=Characodon lateralis TaxID=208331 RepID=A0ABU7DI69_9TELE|nr:hypothetical protein [Characodon lateralis]